MTTSGAPPISVQAAREVRRATAFRRARTCYDHLAGVAEVDLFNEILNRGWVEDDACENSARLSYRLTLRGKQALADRNVVLTPSSTRRRFAYDCSDWTERRPHWRERWEPPYCRLCRPQTLFASGSYGNATPPGRSRPKAKCSEAR